MSQQQRAILIQDFTKLPVYGKAKIPEPSAGQLLIKVIASTINPSDRIRSKGGYWRTDTPFVGGLQGFGQVIKAANKQHQGLVGKKVSFVTNDGAWCQYTVTDATKCWQVDEDVPLHCAASGIVNPLTVIGFVDTYKKWSGPNNKAKGLINTAAASALGRMLIKYCKRENVPLLNIVRRKQQVQLLKNDGAEFIINTSEQNWVEQYKDLIKNHGFNVLFDAIASGQITDKLVSNLSPGSIAFMYGKLGSQQFIVSKPVVFMQGVSITSFMLFQWLVTLKLEQILAIQKQYSGLLKNQLSTNTAFKLKLEQVMDKWEESQIKATDGKVTIII